MSWHDRVPGGISNVEKTNGGFQASLSLPVDEDGFFGRECMACQQLFKVLVDQWEALPDEAIITCPYCGKQREDVNDFMTGDQSARVEAALNSLVEQYTHQLFGETLDNAFRSKRTRRSGGGMFGVEISLHQGAPPPIRTLPDYVEDKVLRTLTCDRCSTVVGVYDASAFCPVCGPRPALETVLEAIDGARLALDLEDELPSGIREQARAVGVFGNVAADTVRRIVTLFEVFARDQFETRVSTSEEILRVVGRGVFQRLDDADHLFLEHTGVALSALVDETKWSRLKVTFQQRHVLVHLNGRIDQQYLDRAGGSQQVGQALVISRREAEQGLADLEALTRALSSTVSDTVSSHAQGCA